MPYDSDTAIGGPYHGFPQTRHSLIDAAGSGGTIGGDAIADIISVYWKPAYKYVRIKWRKSNEEAKDVVQGFFAAMLDSDFLGNFDAGKGSFRTYLRSSLDHFVMKVDEIAGRLKRGGGVDLVSLDFDSAEHEIATTVSACSPEEVFFREWQRQLFSLGIQDLERLCDVSNKRIYFAVFQDYDLADERPQYAEVAARHRIAVTDVTNYLSWCRRELRRLVLARLSAITTNGQEHAAEARTLFGSQDAPQR